MLKYRLLTKAIFSLAVAKSLDYELLNLRPEVQAEVI